ncbi:putative mannosyl-glycoprotein endo-beta-N-acetylglucosaminidase [Helianthus annuus]|nr:putative mannosyl-glycoprotein endo-beta-N-acetylglucosaminidase [Helianthus annuus]
MERALFERYNCLKDLKDVILKRHIDFRDMASGLVLGTFIVEWDEGRVIAEQFLATTTNAKMYAECLAKLADKLGFDGWQINMEVTLNVEKIPTLKEFVDHLTKTMHSAVAGSLVIWKITQASPLPLLVTESSMSTWELIFLVEALMVVDNG